jgi:hypothetical protein
MTKHKQMAAELVRPGSSRDWPALLRRSLVILVTALIVARPLVLGEDPGLLDPASDAAGLTLTLLWLVAAVCWAGWRLWYGQGAWHGGLVEAGLLATAGCYFLSSGFAANYRHPAWIISCEWLVLVVCLSLVRQLAGTARDRRGLLAAVLATGVALSAYGIYQAVVELPRQRSYSQDRESLRRHWEQETGRPIDVDDPELALLIERLQQNNIFGTFANPNSFAGYLALLLPLAVGYAVVAWWRRDSTWQPVLAVVAAGLVALALFLTHSRGANLATLLVAAVLGLWFGRHFLRRHLAWTVGGLAVLVVASVLATRAPSDKPAVGQSLTLRLNYWRAAWGMVRDHLWLGIGPGNFNHYYPRYMVPTAVDEKIGEPHNLVLDVWTAAGVFALAGLLLALGTFAWRLTQVARSPTAVPRDPLPEPDEDAPWDYYLGGMGGLLLAFLLKAAAAPSPDHVLIWGVEAGTRSVIWFAAFALFWSIPWSGPSVLLAVIAGVAVCLLNLLVSGGISSPSVAQPLWIQVGLALALATASSPGWILRRGLGLFLPLPVLAGMALTYFLLVYLPANGCDYHLRQARTAQELFREKAHKPQTLIEAGRYSRYATEQLQQAHLADPANVNPLVVSAQWSLELNVPPPSRGLDTALKNLEQARDLDPGGKEVRLLTFQVRRQLATQAPEKERQRRLEDMREAGRAILAVDPTESTRLHVLLAETYFEMHDLQACYPEAVAAWQEDWQAQEQKKPAYQLTAALRGQVRGWIDHPWRWLVGPVLAQAPEGPFHVLPALYLSPDRPTRPPKPRSPR